MNLFKYKMEQYLDAIKTKRCPYCYSKDVDYDGMLIAQSQTTDQCQPTKFLQK